MEPILVSILVVSASANVFLFYLLKSQRKKPAPSVEAEAILADLMRGQALVRVSRVAPSDVFLRSPRT